LAKHTIVNALTAATAEKLGNFLRNHSIKVKHVSEQEATKDKLAHQKAVENKTWIGRDCHVLLENIDAVLSLVYTAPALPPAATPAQRQANTAQQGVLTARKTACAELWHAFFAAYDAMMSFDDGVNWETQAAAYQVLASVFGAKFEQFIGEAGSGGTYVHIMVAHAADQMREGGALCKDSTQALEHLHSVRLHLLCVVHSSFLPVLILFCAHPITASQINPAMDGTGRDGAERLFSCRCRRHRAAARKSPEGHGAPTRLDGRRRRQ